MTKQNIWLVVFLSF